MSEKRAASFVAHHEHSSKDDFRTPAYLFEWIDRKFGPVEYDAACFADGSNALATPLRLEDEWPNHSVIYSNPPFRDYVKWLDKGRLHALKGGIHILLIPNRLCQVKVVERLSTHLISEIWCLGGRVNFEGPHSVKGGASRTGTIILVQRKSFFSAPLLFAERLSNIKKWWDQK